MSGWMLYCVAVTALVGAAAWALERALRSAGGRRQARWVWAAALGAALLAGAGALVRPAPSRPPAPGASRAASAATVRAPSTAGVAAAAAAREHEGPSRLSGVGGPRSHFPALPPLRGPLTVAWVAMSALALLRLGAGALRLRRARRGWRQTVVDGAPVLLSPDVGPAVVGAVRCEIVLPRWALELDPARRALVIAHEREHVRARDPLLLAAAHAAVALAPWNPALWWLAAELRRAVELDCDARVLRAHPDVRGYGALLIEVGRRAALGVAGWRRVPATALLHSSSTLERRIRTMTQSRTPRSHAIRSLLLAAAALAAAALTPRPPALLAQSATAGSRDSARASSASGTGGTGQGSSSATAATAGSTAGGVPRVVRVVPRGGSGSGSGASASGSASAAAAPTLVRVEARGGGSGRGGSGSDSLRFRFTERSTDEQLAKGYLMCAAQQSRTGTATIELIVAEEAAGKPGRVTVLLDRSEGSEVSVRFGRGTADSVGCSGSETPWLRLSAGRVQQDAHVLHIATPVALRLVARTPSGRTLADLDIGTRTRADSMTFEW